MPKSNQVCKKHGAILTPHHQALFVSKPLNSLTASADILHACGWMKWMIIVKSLRGSVAIQEPGRIGHEPSRFGDAILDIRPGREG